ncbi:hypothetical protein BC834DRAFT_400643 [Gloeopeniophorella convolvens]|nr:hypothetical protein BC834DRAFT_400643 [Gloeopeniophorella convolvens]
MMIPRNGHFKFAGAAMLIADGLSPSHRRRRRTRSLALATDGLPQHLRRGDVCQRARRTSEDIPNMLTSSITATQGSSSRKGRTALRASNSEKKRESNHRAMCVLETRKLRTRVKLRGRGRRTEGERFCWPAQSRSLLIARRKDESPFAALRRIPIQSSSWATIINCGFLSVAISPPGVPHPSAGLNK